MKNADMPAMPVMDGDNEPANLSHSYYQNLQLATGLTKREMMAMHAPEMPDWFDGQWRKEFEGNEMYFMEEEDEWGSTHLQITKHGVNAMYFAWRVTYAEKLLLELDRTSK